MDITNSSISSITVEYNDQNVNFIQNQIPNNKINSFEISKCPSTDEAFKIISNDSFRSTILQKFPSLIALRIKIENNLEKIEVRKTEFQEWSKFLLSFESMTENQIVVFFKNEGSEEFFKLSLLNNNVPTLVKYFAINFMIEALNNKNDKILFCSNQKFDLSTLINNSYRNLLIEAVHKNDLKLVQEILKLPIDVNWKIYKEVKGKVDFDLAIDIAWSRRNFQIVYELLNANSMYPKDFKEEEKEEAFDDIKNFYEISKDMFEAIQSNNKDKVLKVLEKKPYLRYFFNKSNTSAIKFAVREKTFEIYQILCEHNVTYGPDEPFKEICDPDFLKQISNYNSSIAKSLPEYHIMVLLSKSVLSQNDVNFHERLNSIKNAFENLNLIPEIKPILQILAFDKKTKFIFDFTQNSIVYMNPALRELTKAAYIPDKHHIQIAAKMLLEDETKNETQASLAHECYHFGFDLVFMNERLPYENGDEKNQKKFQNLIEECKNLQASEPIIKEIFEIYKSPAFGRELAVRVPHMLAFYQNNPEKIKELKKIFKNLFDYHEKNVMPEIKAAVEFYKKFADESNEINFKDLTKPLKAAVKHSFVDFQEKNLKILEVFDDQMLENLSSKQIREILNGQKLKIGKNLENIQNTFYKLRKFINTEFKGEILEYKKEEQKYKVTGLAKENTKNIDEIIAEVESSKIFILPDAAGAGKSTTMKFLAWKIKEKKPQNWISVIDLKRHLKIYETYKNSFLKSNPTKKEDENIILKILLEILSISDDFEILFFSHLFTNGRVILFFDGVDEIAPKYENIFINLIINIKKLTNIQQWIATRPQHEKDIKEKVEHGIAYKFLPFDSKEVNLFITKYMRFKNINLDLKSIETVIENLKIYENVLMLTMIIELQIAGKLPIENINQYSLYEAMVEMKIDIVADKGSLVNRDAYTVSKMTLWEIHQIYAFKLLFEGEKFENFYSNKILKSQNFHYSDDENEKESKFVKFENFQMFKKWSREKSKWTPDKISRCGFLTVIGWNGDNEFPEFNHRTYAEFFVAKFIVEDIAEAIGLVDELSELEFENRMKLAFFMIKDYFIKSSESHFIVQDFIVDYLKHQRPNINFSSKFYDFLEKSETRNYIKCLNDGFGKVGFNIYKFYIFVSKFNEISNSNSKIIKKFTFIDENRSKLFVCALNELYDCFLLCTFMFGLFKNSNLNNWHKFTTFGHNLQIEELKLPTNEELENITQKFLTTQEIFDNENDKIYENLRWSEKEKLEVLKQFYQFFCFIAAVDDFSLSQIQRLLKNFSENFSVWILRSQNLATKLFEIATKYFYNDKVSFARILNEIVNFAFLILREHKSLKFGSKFIEYFEDYYENIKKFLQNEREVLQIVFCEHHLLCFVILTKSKRIIQMYKNYQDQNIKFFTSLINSFYVIPTDFDKNIALINFNEFCAEISGFDNIFQFFFNCADLESIFGFIDAFRKTFDDWQRKTGYSPKSFNLSLMIIPTKKELEEIANELYSTDYTSRFDFENLILLWSIIETFNIPKVHLDNFNSKHSEKCLEFATKFKNDLNSTRITNQITLVKCRNLCNKYLPQTTGNCILS